MPVYIHKVFEQPQPDANLWRYMDLSKYVSMLATGSLWFARMDLLGDPYEGSTSRANIKAREGAKESTVAWMQKMRHLFINNTFVNCWHMGEHESVAMWRRYMKDHGVAIVSNYTRMCNSMGGDVVFVGKVHYIDYSSDVIDESNAYSHFLHKRKSFEHEKEVRAVVTNNPVEGVEETRAGIQVPVNVNILLSEVRVTPDAPSWFADCVSSVTAQYGVTCGVRQSDLADPAVY